MRANNHAIIILYRGNDASDSVIEGIKDVLVNSKTTIPEMLTIKYKDEDGVANALVRDVEPSRKQKQNNSRVQDAINNAVIYIGEKFKASLEGVSESIFNIAVFATELTNAVVRARSNASFIGVGSENELLTAVEIISTSNGVIPSSLAKKYNFSNDVVKVIKRVYYSY